ncbi:uracil-DNA glycosylase family protein [Flagellimonas taeanensis]|uniref:uracil-DNA glycosylase family protein n=1 Tax=Flavobacteriaceae TaxID=49546 RepID=UPI000B838F0F|nr:MULTISPECIES: uracil-DNA glycosylase family protein [Allomuricauda]MDC6384403.1 uracil-DNA glycosylase family protein [Muricauda sp. SK9]RIV49752.1 uracil-DNA glycosylase family protein [Allomuricauda taeanensis]RIV53951.1 uracil-DNA glycosylase family protein [Allomuricauda taeanensis]
MVDKPFKHTHPYEPFLFPEVTKLIVGTLPPPRFTTGDLKKEDVDFCYGSCNGMLWPILDRIFELGLKYETTFEAISQRETFLRKHKIGVCDIVASAERTKIDASDLGMQNVELRDLVGYLKKYANIHTILFMGGNSKNGPEYFFRRQLKEHDLKLDVVNDEVPRVHQFELPTDLSPMSVRAQSRTIKTVSLTAPSGTANRAVGSLQAYKDLKAINPEFNTLDFRVMQYRAFFENDQ